MRLTEIHDAFPQQPPCAKAHASSATAEKMAISSILTVGLARQKMSIMNQASLSGCIAKNGVLSTSAFGASQSGAPFLTSFCLFPFSAAA